ncbi:MAG: hypothetical protein ACR2IV_21870 [Bryobacteraceae bacterium]
MPGLKCGWYIHEHRSLDRSYFIFTHFNVFALAKNESAMATAFLITYPLEQVYLHFADSLQGDLSRP